MYIRQPMDMKLLSGDIDGAFVILKGNCVYCNCGFRYEISGMWASGIPCRDITEIYDLMRADPHGAIQELAYTNFRKNNPHLAGL